MPPWTRPATVLLCAAEAAQAGSATGTGSAGQTVTGMGLGLVAGATYAVYAWAAHRLITRGVASRAAMGAVFGLGGLMLVPVLLATGAPLLASWTNAGVGLHMALVPMFTGYVLFGFGLSRMGPQKRTLELISTVTSGTGVNVCTSRPVAER